MGADVRNEIAAADTPSCPDRGRLSPHGIDGCSREAADPLSGAMTMHEYSILRALLDRVEAEAHARNASAVRRIRVRIGEFAGVEPELLLSAYSLLRERTICQDAELEIRSVKARWECPPVHAASRAARCCSAPTAEAPARLASGDEIMLDQIAMEVP